jgi:hypothetical protein
MLNVNNIILRLLFLILYKILFFQKYMWEMDHNISIKLYNTLWLLSININLIDPIWLKIKG